MKANAYDVSRPKFGLLQLGIVLLTLVTTVIHVVLAFTAPDPLFTPLFLLNGLGYLVMLAGLYLSLPFTQGRRELFRWGLIGLAALSILAWLVVGDKSSALGIFTKAVEALLIILLLVDRRS